MRNRMLVLITGLVYIALAFSPSMAGVIRAMVYVSLLLVFVFPGGGDAGLWEKPSSGRFALAAVLNVILLIRFYVRLSPSSAVASLASRIGLRPGLLLLMAGTAAAVVSLPFAARLIGLLLSFIMPEDDPMRLRIVFSPDRAYGKCFIFAWTGILVMIAASFVPDIWADEAFTLRMIERSYSEIISITAADVHPPLYYLLLKAVSSVFTVILPGRWAAVFAGKLFSVLGYALLLMTCGKIRRQWGNYVAGMWAVCVTGMNHMLHYGTEIRMYGWSMLLVTLAYIYANEIMQTATKRSWIFFVVFGLAAAYTHYFACIGVGVIYLMLLLWFLRNDRRELRGWIAAAAATLLLYLPWLLVLSRQLRTISTDYWIEPVTLKDISDYFIFMFGPVFFLLFCLYLCLRVFVTKGRTILKDGDSVYALGGVMIPFGTMIIGIIVSVVFRPVFVSRYLVPGLAGMWLGLLILCSRQARIAEKRLMILLVLFVALTNVTAFMEEEYHSFSRSSKTISFLAEHENAVYVTDNWHMAQDFSLLSDTGCYLWGEEMAAVYVPVYRNLSSMYDEAGIRELLDSGRDVFFIDYSDSRSEGALIDDLLLPGVTAAQDLGRFWMEHEVQVYQIVYAR